MQLDSPLVGFLAPKTKKKLSKGQTPGRILFATGRLQYIIEVDATDTKKQSSVLPQPRGITLPSLQSIRKDCGFDKSASVYALVFLLVTRYTPPKEIECNIRSSWGSIQLKVPSRNIAAFMSKKEQNEGDKQESIPSEPSSGVDPTANTSVTEKAAEQDSTAPAANTGLEPTAPDKHINNIESPNDHDPVTGAGDDTADAHEEDEDESQAVTLGVRISNISFYTL